MAKLPTKKITLELNEDELVVLQYLIDISASPYASDPLKDIYEADHKPFDAAMDGGKGRNPYDALKSLAKKTSKI